MPDLFTHCAAGYWVGHGCRLSESRLALLVFGCTVPDLWSRVPLIVTNALTGVDSFWFWSGLHAPLAVVAGCYWISLWFAEAIRREVFKILLIGSLFHQFLDLWQGQTLGGYMLWLPFSLQLHHWDWFHSANSVLLFPLFFILTFLLYRERSCRPAK